MKKNNGAGTITTTFSFWYFISNRRYCTFNKRVRELKFSSKKLDSLQFSLFLEGCHLSQWLICAPVTCTEISCPTVKSEVNITEAKSILRAMLDVGGSSKNPRAEEQPELRTSPSPCHASLGPSIPVCWNYPHLPPKLLQIMFAALTSFNFSGFVVVCGGILFVYWFFLFICFYHLHTYTLQRQVQTNLFHHQTLLFFNWDLSNIISLTTHPWLCTFAVRTTLQFEPSSSSISHWNLLPSHILFLSILVHQKEIYQSRCFSAQWKRQTSITPPVMPLKPLDIVASRGQLELELEFQMAEAEKKKKFIGSAVPATLNSL